MAGGGGSVWLSTHALDVMSIRHCMHERGAIRECLIDHPSGPVRLHAPLKDFRYNSTFNLVDVSDFFFLFRGAGEGEASEEVAGAPFFYKKIEGGGGSEEEVREGEGRRGNVCGEGGGGG